MKKIFQFFTLVLFIPLLASSIVTGNSIEVNGVYDVEAWTTDTVFISGDASFNELTISPGTVIIFSGDYHLSIIILDGNGQEGDSIQVIGDVNGLTRQGNFEASGTLKGMPTYSQYVSFTNLKKVTTWASQKSRYSNCDSVQADRSTDCLFRNNQVVYFDGKLTTGEVIDNNAVYFSLAPSFDYGESEFVCTNTNFINNESGIKLDSLKSFEYGYNNSYISFDSCNFTQNGDTALNVPSNFSSSLYLNNNIFSNNEGPAVFYNTKVNYWGGLIAQGNLFSANDGLAIYSDANAFKISNNIFLENGTHSGPGAVFCVSNDNTYGSSKSVLLNNTFWNNSGETTSTIEAKSTDSQEIIIANNIFWNNSASGSNYDISIDMHPVLGVDKLTFTNNVSSTSSDFYLITGLDEEPTIGPLFYLYPEFTDTLSYDFSIASSSPYIDNGSEVADTYLPEKDILGNDRIQGNLVDMGATEYSVSGVPSILHQTGDTCVSPGEIVVLSVGTDERYFYQWNSSETGEEESFNPIEDETDNQLLIETENEFSPFYQLSVASHTDTIWSDIIKVEVNSEKLIDDTVYLSSLEQRISLYPGKMFYQPSYNIEWDPEIDNQYTVPAYGEYWVKYNASPSCRKEQQFSVLQPTGNIHLKGNYFAKQYLDNDSVFIDGNTDFQAGIQIEGSIVVKFSGNHTLESYYMTVNGNSYDSVRFLGFGNESDLKSTKMDMNFQESSTLKNTIFEGFRLVDIENAKGVTVRNSENVIVNTADSSKFIANHSLRLHEFVKSSLITGNQNIIAYARASHSIIFDFIFTNNIVQNNTSGVQVSGKPELVIFDNNVFNSNTETAIKLKAISALLRGNLFFDNSSSTGAGAVEILNGTHSLEFVNNTLYSNGGMSSDGINLNDELSEGLLINNIFWIKDPESPAVYISANDFLTSDPENIKISHNIIESGLAGLQIPQYASVDTHTIYTFNPNFENVDLKDFSLKFPSPAIDSGKNIPESAPEGYEYETDILDSMRVYMSAPDLGAYEYWPETTFSEILASNDTIVCQNVAVDLSVTPEDYFDYTWYKNSYLMEGADSNSVSVLSPSESESDYYLVRITNITDTVWSDTITVSIAHTPVVSATDTIIEACTGDTVELSVEYTSDLPVSFSWENIYQIPYNEADSNLTLYRVRENETFVVQASNACGAGTADTIEVVVHPLPDVELGKDTSIYASDSLLLDPVSIEASFSWSTGSDDETIYAYAGETIFCVVTDMNGCVNSDTIEIGFKPLNILDNLIDGTINIYPLPARDQLTIDLNQELDLPVDISIIQLSGSILGKYKILPGEKSIVLRDLPGSGIYLLRIGYDNSYIVKKITISGGVDY